MESRIQPTFSGEYTIRLTSSQDEPEFTAERTEAVVKVIKQYCQPPKSCTINRVYMTIDHINIATDSVCVMWQGSAIYTDANPLRLSVGQSMDPVIFTSLQICYIDGKMGSVGVLWYAMKLHLLAVWKI